MDCPVCRQALVVIERSGVELDWCLTCRGLWFDEGELELLAGKCGRQLEPSDVGRPARRTVARPTRKCPRCRRPMDRVHVGSRDAVHVDRCAAHGVWLDHGELGRIMSQLELITAADEKLIIDFLGETFRSQLASPTAAPERDQRGPDGD